MNRDSINFLKKNWTVAEMQVSYKPKLRTKIKIKSTDDAHKVLREMWDKSLINLQEQICAIFLNTKNEVIGFRIISTGKLNASTIDVKLILSCALISRSNSLILAHNHPSGDLTPSDGDIATTVWLQEVCEMLCLKLLDHIILTDSDFYSFKENEIVFND